MSNYTKSYNFRNGIQVDDDNFVVNSIGLVGIGTTTPDEHLDVRGNIKVVGDARITGYTSVTNIEVVGVMTVGAGITLDPGSGIITATKFIGDASGLKNIVAIATDGFIANVGSLTTTAKIGLGNLTPTNQLDVSGNSKFVGVTTFSGITTSPDTIFSNTLSAITLEVDGASTFSRGITANDNLKVTGISTFNDMLNAAGNITIFNGSPKIHLTDNNNDSDFRIGNSDGKFVIHDSTANATRLRVQSSGLVEITNNLDVDGQTDLDVLNVAETATFSALVDVNNRLDVVGGANIDELNVTGITTLGSGGSGQAVLEYQGVTKLKTVSAGASVYNQLNVASLNWGTSGLSSYSGSLRYGHELAGSAPFSTRRSLDLINNDSGNINFYLNANNLSVPIGGGDFHWHKGFNNAQLMTLTNTGLLGIGETQPNTTLHVQGISTVTGKSFVGGIFYAKSNVVIDGNTDIGGNLSVDGSFSLSSTLNANVSGNVTGKLIGNVLANSGVSTFNSVAIATDFPAGGIGLDGSEVTASFLSVGVGTTSPNSGADFASCGETANERYMIPPTITTAERNGIGETANGGLIFNSTLKRLEVYIDNGWVGIATTT